MTDHYVRASCRACGKNSFERFLSLGRTPLANEFLSSPAEFDDERSYPLDVYFCNSCSLVQLLDVVDPEILFRNYVYLTGISATIAAHNRRYAQSVVDRLRPANQDLIVEVASNDGSLLKCFRTHGVRTLGVEPALNIAQIAQADGVETVARFFDASVAQDILTSHGRARAVIGNNVLAHVDHTQEFLQGCKQLLTDDGLVIVEVPYLREFIERLEYDTIYHEHLCYFSVTALLRLCDAVGLCVVDLEHIPVHGGSIRLYAGLPDRYGGHSDHVTAQAAEEKRIGLTAAARYRQFAAEVDRNRQQLLSILRELRAGGSTIAAYGAPAKGNTLLNYCGIDTSLIPFTVDRNPLKVGTYTPGAHIPVEPVSSLLERQPDYTLILPWNIADEIISQQAEYRARGGKFIIPIPEPRVI